MYRPPVQQAGMSDELEHALFFVYACVRVWWVWGGRIQLQTHAANSSGADGGGEGDAREMRQGC